MAFREIFRSTKNDGQGDDAYVWAGKTNENMKELFGLRFPLGDTLVSRLQYDSADPSLDAYKDGDKVEGWAVDGERYVEGKILDAANFTWPDDIDYRDGNGKNTRFFKTLDVESL